MNPTDYKYTKTHEWVKVENAQAIVGITDHAQNALGDITFVELPTIGKRLAQGKEAAVIESVKAASDIYAPLSGEVVEVNQALETAPEAINASPYGDGWIFRLQSLSAGELNGLMDASAYDAFLESSE
jgi:glycine cleavage system H protein